MRVSYAFLGPNKSFAARLSLAQSKDAEAIPMPQGQKRSGIGYHYNTDTKVARSTGKPWVGIFFVDKIYQGVLISRH